MGNESEFLEIYRQRNFKLINIVPLIFGVGKTLHWYLMSWLTCGMKKGTLPGTRYISFFSGW